MATTSPPRVPNIRSARRVGRALGAAATGAVLLLAGACGVPDRDDAAEGAGPGFPVTIEHKYGTTTITEKPKNVVTVGLTEQDALLALGVVPVGTTAWLGEYPGAVGPWAEDELGDAEPPKVLDATDGPQVEKIAALEPDLIVGLYSGLTKEQYTALDKIAPTIAQPKEYGDYGIPWQEATTTVGKALGEDARAKTLVADTEKRFEEARAENPEFKEATALMATPFEGYVVFGPQDPRSRVLDSLGFTLPEGLEAAVGDEFSAEIDAENTDLLDTDALVWFVPSVAESRADLHKSKVYGGLDVAGQGREVFIEEESVYGHATSFVTALSIPYQLDRLVPQLAAAVDGKTGTEVEPAE